MTSNDICDPSGLHAGAMASTDASVHSVGESPPSSGMTIGIVAPLQRRPGRGDRVPSGDQVRVERPHTGVFQVVEPSGVEIPWRVRVHHLGDP